MRDAIIALHQQALPIPYFKDRDSQFGLPSKLLPKESVVRIWLSRDPLNHYLSIQVSIATPEAEDAPFEVTYFAALHILAHCRPSFIYTSISATALLRSTSHIARKHACMHVEPLKRLLLPPTSGHRFPQYIVTSEPPTAGLDFLPRTDLPRAVERYSLVQAASDPSLRHQSSSRPFANWTIITNYITAFPSHSASCSTVSLSIITEER
ncbi:hypothetical protein FMUND_13513 [Fusarium mundagurra]|uniref:Uncharacterized protein n=1 Tax=Fusarium mundagurra TaxID=1567541 RepID=A0A8H6D3K9_9HYPO|nr:hypothetical protein FMUND_13513 [Fusarium mundagurra]